MEDDLDYCHGCAIPVSKRVNLPETWQEGDPLPENLTVHATRRSPRRFAFKGDPRANNRVYLDGRD